MCCIALLDWRKLCKFFPGFRQCRCCRSELAKNVIGDIPSILFMMCNLTVSAFGISHMPSYRSLRMPSLNGADEGKIAV